MGFFLTEMSGSVDTCWPILTQFTPSLYLFIFKLSFQELSIYSFPCVSHIYVKS